MKGWVRLIQPIIVGALLFISLSAANTGAFQAAAAEMASEPAALLHPSVEGVTGEILFSKLLEHNRLRESRLQQYSVARVYRITNDKGKVRAETLLSLEYHSPDTKEYKILSEKGSGFVRNRVFKRLVESEVETAAGRNRHDSSITPNNYTFELLGEDDEAGHHCFVVQAIPKRKDKYLFEGKVWIESQDFAIVKIVGQPAKNPSFWIRHVDFERHYQKIGEFWLPLKDESTTQVKIFGTNILTIEYGHYEIAQAKQAGKKSGAEAVRGS